MAELLEVHHRSRVHVTAFDFSPEDGTAHRARLRGACDEMVPIHTLSDRAAAEAIQQPQHRCAARHARAQLGSPPRHLALRPAPIMGGYLGFIGTTALPWLDFVVTDRWTMPESVTPYMTERPLYIDGR